MLKTEFKLQSNMTYVVRSVWLNLQITNLKTYITGATSGTWTAYPSGTSEFTRGFKWGMCCSIVSFLWHAFVDRCLSFCAFHSVALFTKILTIKNCRKCKTKIKKSFTKILTIILSVKIVLTLRVKLPCPKCKILIVRDILVLSFIVSERKMDDVLALRPENKRAIHR